LGQRTAVWGCAVQTVQVSKEFIGLQVGFWSGIGVLIIWVWVKGIIWRARHSTNPSQVGWGLGFGDLTFGSGLRESSDGAHGAGAQSSLCRRLKGWVFKTLSQNLNSGLEVWGAGFSVQANVGGG
jgi:hypothetical protein